VNAEAIWRALGGAGELPSIAGRFHGPLLILGGGESVYQDWAAVRPWKGSLMAVNDVGQFIHEPLSHWVTLHPEYFPGWRHYRRKHNYQGTPICHSNKHAEGVDKAWPLDNIGGTSGLFATLVGLMLYDDEIVLAGIPMDNNRHFFDPPWYGHDLGDRANQLCWQDMIQRGIFKGRVTSLSGRTRGWLGSPVKVAA
jgi:hypothetical protein